MKSSLCFLFLISAVGSLAAPQAVIGSTTLNGVDQPAFGADFFGGIPFAQPPVGSLRFSPPVPVTTLAGATFDATNFGAPCMQLPAQAGMSEDCLTLNVFRPAGVPAGANLPVMTWIFGGGFIQGMSSTYNASLIVGESIARGTPIVFVTLNYRLGPFGFPTGSEALKNGAVNLGLKDQLAALKWIQTNIASFGGDKTKVTLLGQSAGAMSISQLFLNSKLETLVRAVILESGSAASLPLFPAQTGTALWQTFASFVPECASASPGNTFGCLRSANAQELLGATAALSQVAPQLFDFVPVVDGPGGVIPAMPSTLIAQGKFSKIPFIAGTVLDEGTDFVPPQINSTEALVAFLKAGTSTIGANVSAVPGEDAFVAQLLKLYPDDPTQGSPFGTGNQTFGLSSQWKRAAAILGDMSFQSLRRQWITAAANCNVKTFGYLFTDPQANPATGVSHGSEVFYLFGVPILSGPPTAAFLSSLIIEYWVSFATSLTPNDGKGTARPTWPQYTRTNKVLMQLNSQALTTIPDNYRAPQIDFLINSPTELRH